MSLTAETHYLEILITLPSSLSDEIHIISLCKRGQSGASVGDPLGRGMKRKERDEGFEVKRQT